MRFRKLRIAWSVGCGIACLLLIVLWARSYFRIQHFAVLTSPGTLFHFVPVKGELYFYFSPTTVVVSPGILVRELAPEVVASMPAAHRKLGFRFIRDNSQSFLLLAVPVWSLVLLSLASAAASWLHWRFSLRTLLIAATLVAGALGLTVWAAKS